VVHRSAALWLSLAALPWSAGCTTPDAFACNADAQCIDDAKTGRCEPEGVCSFPDGGCPSGHRYGLFAGELAGECVAGGSSSGSTEPGGTSVLPEGSAEAEVTSSTAPDDESSSTTSTGSTTTTTSMTSTSEPETTGSTLDPYSPCADASACPVEGSVCIPNPSGSSVCAPPCNDEPCVYDGDTRAELGCYPVGNGGSACVFLCSDDTQCPDGMVCDAIMGIGYCAWAPGTGP
jgi:hypothetical protein